MRYLLLEFLLAALAANGLSDGTAHLFTLYGISGAALYAFHFLASFIAIDITRLLGAHVSATSRALRLSQQACVLFVAFLMTQIGAATMLAWLGAHASLPLFALYGIIAAMLLARRVHALRLAHCS